MEDEKEAKPAADNGDLFLDAADDFSSADPPGALESPESAASDFENVPVNPDQIPEIPLPNGLRRRRSASSDSSSGISSKNAGHSSRETEFCQRWGLDVVLDEQMAEDVKSTPMEEPESREVWLRQSRSLSLPENDDGRSSVSSVTNERIDNSSAGDTGEEFTGQSSSFLVYFAGLIVKSIAFNFKLLKGCFSLPFLSVYYFFAFVTNPVGTLWRGTEYFADNVRSIGLAILRIVFPFVLRWSNEYKSILQLALRCSWGCLWSIYVGIVLVGLLVSSLLMSGLTMRFMVEEPLQLKETLYFDYTQNSPAAYFPITSCPSVSCGVDCVEKVGVPKSRRLRAIPPDHNFQVTVSITLPESDYNRNLGIFQVRVDCLSANGTVLATSRHPCMLPFKSETIRFLLTYLKIFPLLAGYISESQILDLKIRDFIEGNVPTACLRVLIEPRAEFQPSAGIPEIYDASLLLESDLPMLKRILWCWKTTAFVWTTMTFFMMGLMFTLCCCCAIIFPIASASSSAAGGGSPIAIVVGREFR